MVVLLAFALSVSGCGQESGVKVSKEQYGSDWPFLVDSAIIDCVDGNAAVIKTLGRVYALNGHAMAKGYANLNPIWKPDHKNPDLKIPIGDFINLALEQC